MRGILTLDRLPALAMAGLLVLAGVGAAHYVRVAPRSTPDPFTVVWASYEPSRAMELIGFALLGVIIAWVLPLGQGLDLADFQRAARSQVNRLLPLWLLIGFGGLALIIGVKGQYLLEAPAYLMSDAPQALVSVANLIAPAALVAAGVVSASRPWMGYLMLAALAVCLFASATRVFAGTVLLFAIGRVLAGRRVKALGWLAVGLVTLVLLPVPLATRSLQVHGLWPYVEQLPVILSDGYLAAIQTTVAQSIGFSVPLMIFVADRTDFPFQNQLIALNPAPSGIAGWTEITDSMRVHTYIPFSMLGEFAHFGGLVMTAAVACLLGVLRWCILRVGRTESSLMPFVVAVVLGLALLAVLYAQQYNTRSVSRIVSVILLVVIVNAVVHYLRRGVRTPTESSLRRRRRRQPPAC